MDMQFDKSKLNLKSLNLDKLEKMVLNLRKTK